MASAGTAALAAAALAVTALAAAVAMSLLDGGASARASRPWLQIAFLVAVGACIAAVAVLDRREEPPGRARLAITLGLAVIMLSPFLIVLTGLVARLR